MRVGRIVIGIDGGGTKTIAAAADMEGNVLAFSRGDGINYNQIGLEKARQNLKEALAALFARCDGEIARIVIGCPALDQTADEETVLSFCAGFLDPAKVTMESDVYTAALGLNPGGPCMMVICGTGSMIVTLDKAGRQKTAGGWGHILGDFGSGYLLSVQGLQCAIRQWEGFGAETVLASRAMEFFHFSNPRELIDRVYDSSCDQARLARFAKEVLIAAREGDDAANNILKSNMRSLACQARHLLSSAPEVDLIGLYGGVFQHSALARDTFQAELKRLFPDRSFRFIPPALPPELGAMVPYYRQNGLWNEQTLHNLQTSYAAIRKTEDRAL